MKRTILPIAALLLAVTANAETATNSVSATDFKSFKIIADRNIFNSNRSPGSRQKGKAERVVKVESITLLGTIAYEKGRFAFFDGSSSEYHTTISPEQSIAGYKVAEVNYDNVKLATTNGEPVKLCVGSQMKRVDEGPWTISEKADPITASTSSSTGSSSSSSSVSLPEDDSDSPSDSAEAKILKKLMKKRKKELNK